ncbi:reverse transcriptase domain-containing protein [Methylomagnum ishizawai]|uniref:reverse transcriptase domain-containing protein n=1 Tax=Methylomagnum ishizawai TaxID=1760988 RepID=UPI001C38373C|nr:reverse transcriptase domain-containing protein [Methylomagnum ishizawai]
MPKTITIKPFTNTQTDDLELFSTLFSPTELEAVFNAKFQKTIGKGTDRLNGHQFAKRAPQELAIASVKCINGKYRFAPYLETLRTKGRDKPPRLIGIPTIRDRVILHQLNKYLAAIYPYCVPKNIANSYIKNITSDLQEITTTTPNNNIWICKTDIKTFYDSINQTRLLSILRQTIKSNAALRLIERALITPTVPKNTRQKNHSEFRPSKGVPQGLAISNILASIICKTSISR